MPIYMKYEGVDGSVTSAGHEKWIELESCQLGLARHITGATGRGTNREASVPAISEIVVTKNQENSTTGLFRMSLHGEGKKVKIDFTKTDKDKFETYLSVELENTLISNFSVSGHGGDGHARPMESLALNFTNITLTTIVMDAANKTGKPDRATWDAALGKAS
jgi:type VI secretion system secreted protein Hcp